jgi:hypothetical protein
MDAEKRAFNQSSDVEFRVLPLVSTIDLAFSTIGSIWSRYPFACSGVLNVKVSSGAPVRWAS